MSIRRSILGLVTSWSVALGVSCATTKSESAPPAADASSIRSDGGARDLSDGATALDAGAASTDGRAVAAAFYVAPDGADGNPGTLDQPFATLGRAQAAMRASATIKTTYLRAGTYQPPAIAGSCAWNHAAGTSLQLGAADSGETWSAYPPDGQGSAILDGQSTVGTSGSTGGNGAGCGISLSGAQNVTISGLQFQNYLWSGIWAYQSNNLQVRDNVVHGIKGVLFGSATIFVAASPGATVANNVLFSSAYHGILIVDDSPGGGSTSDTLVAGNVVLDACQWPAVAGGGDDMNGGDCGALYFWSKAPSVSTNVRYTGNYVRDVNASSKGAGDWGACCTVGVYLDDGANNVSVSGNVITGVGSACFLIHGGSGNVLAGNLCDLGASGAKEIVHYQTDALTTQMAGNIFERNLVVAGSAASGPGFVGALSPPTPMTIRNNAYFNYVGAAVNSNGSGGAGSDPAPNDVDPGISCWGPIIQPAGPVFAPPIAFPGLKGGWGPAGFTIPMTGTPPSWPHGC